MRRLVLFGAMLLALTGCASQGKVSAGQPPAASPVKAVPAPCASYGCRPGPAQPLTGDYAIRLWLSPPPADGRTDRATPVLELSRNGQHVGWWTSRLGFGWSASVRCLATPAEPNCVVLSDAGTHAGSAEVVVVRDGALVGSAQASVVFDSGAPIATDLDHDGLLDVLGVDSDYTPSYALGHNYFTSYRLSGDALHRTGCQLRTTAGQPWPTRLLTGACPQIQPS